MFLVSSGRQRICMDRDHHARLPEHSEGGPKAILGARERYFLWIFTTIPVVKYVVGGKNNGFCIKNTTGVVVNLEGGGKFINFASKVNLFTNLKIK